MSSMDPMRDDSLILSETMRKILLRPSNFKQLRNTKSSLLMRQITQPMMYNSSYGRLLRSLVATADSSLPATSKIDWSSHFTPGARVLTFPPIPKTNQNLPQPSSTVSGLYLRKRTLSMIQKFWLNLYRSISPTSEES